ncbi:MAG: DUF721 domain-containing protein [Sphingobacteriales bacterium]|nr:DUF721 domain-containing protein [Sphingobacteriales bacterium]
MVARKDEVTLKEAINKFIEHYNLRIKFDERRITEHWQEIAGELIYRHTTNLFIKENVLFIEVNSSVVKQELIFLKARLKTVINRFLGQEIIKDIKIL